MATDIEAANGSGRPDCASSLRTVLNPRISIALAGLAL
jgi:hypothetical protein